MKTLLVLSLLLVAMAQANEGDTSPAQDGPKVVTQSDGTQEPKPIRYRNNNPNVIIKKDGPMVTTQTGSTKTISEKPKWYRNNNPTTIINNTHTTVRPYYPFFNYPKPPFEADATVQEGTACLNCTHTWGPLPATKETLVLLKSSFTNGESCLSKALNTEEHKGELDSNGKMTQIDITYFNQQSFEDPSVTKNYITDISLTYNGGDVQTSTACEAYN